MKRHRALVIALYALVATFVANAVLGPLGAGVIDYHYSETLTNQGIGLDLVALVLATPVAVAAAVLIGRGHPGGPVLAFAPATFAAYMAPQYVVGPDYLGLPGNSEKAFPLHLAMLVLGAGILIAAWRAVDRDQLLPESRRSDTRRSLVLFAVAAFIAVGRWLPSLVAVMTGEPPPEYRDNPTAFWLIAVLDLGLVVPALVASAVALRVGAGWGRTAAYACIGWFALVPASVATMAVTMVVNDDPLANTSAAVLFSGLALILTPLAAMLYAPMLRAP